MQAHHHRSTDDRLIVTVIWERKSSRSDSPVIEAIYEVEFSDDFTKNESRFLIPLSFTRTDTRETVQLTGEEERELKRFVANYCADLSDNWD